MSERWLTLREAAIELRTSPGAIKTLVKERQLVAITGKNIRQVSAWRILDPAPALRAQLLEPPLENFPVIRPAELAKILGLSSGVIKWHVFMGHIKPMKVNRQLSYFSVKEVRRFLARHERRSGYRKQSYSQVLVDWVKGMLENDMKPNHEVLESLIQQAVSLPEPARSSTIAQLWKHFDEVNALLKECRKA